MYIRIQCGHTCVYCKSKSELNFLCTLCIPCARHAAQASMARIRIVAAAAAAARKDVHHDDLRENTDVVMVVVVRACAFWLCFCCLLLVLVEWR